MNPKIKMVLNEVVPPLAWKLAQRLNVKNPGYTSDEPLGEEKDAEYYEQLGANDHMKQHYSASHYYPTWLVLSDYLKRNNHKAVLDIGCGTGQFAQLLYDSGFEEYVGVDFSNARIERAKQVCPAYVFLCKDVFEPDLIENIKYDVVVMTEFLEHVVKDKQVIQRIKSGTRVMGTVPSYGGSAHVRKFETADTVIDRYGDLLDELVVRSVLIRERGRLHLQVFDGIRK